MNPMNRKNDLADILGPLRVYFDQVDDQIRKILHTGVPLIDESSLHLFAGGGKKIRAALVILVSGIKGSVPEGITPIAAAAEIVHAATLIHDDIIDQSLIRRGEITVPQKWGNKISVLVGDFMYTEALNVAVDDGEVRLFPVIVAGARDMVKGELYQLQYSGIDSVTSRHYFRTIELKTARFMATCAKLGALKAGFDAGESQRFYEYGLNLGYAFQIIDDTLDYRESRDITGKDQGNDYLEGKVTLPVLRILEGADAGLAAKMRSLHTEPVRENWPAVRDIVVSSGAMDYCMKIAGEYIDRAVQLIVEYPGTQFKGILDNLSMFFVERNF